MNPMKINITERNTILENVPYMDDKKKCLCQNGKLLLLTARKGIFISEIMYRDIEKSLNNTHINTSLQREETVYQLRKYHIVILNMIFFVAQIAQNCCV